MDDKLQDTINGILKDAAAHAAQGTDFLKGQIPEVISQLLSWSLIQYLLWGIILLVIAVVFQGIGIYFCRRAMRKDCWDSCGPLPFIPNLFGFVALFFAIRNFLGVWEITVAPKVWLLEYARNLMPHG